MTKNAYCHFWRAGSKRRVSGAKAGHWACLLHTTLAGEWAKGRSHPRPSREHSPTLVPHKEQTCSLSKEGSKGTCGLFPAPLPQQGPVQPSRSFLSGLWETSINYWRPRTPGSIRSSIVGFCVAWTASRAFFDLILTGQSFSLLT